jgi:hypothetical protein
MTQKQEGSPYLTPGRLADVIAVLQIMAAGERPEREIRSWAKELSQSQDEHVIERWNKVFTEHPEFFRVYTIEGQAHPKAALRWRYTNKLYDQKTNKKYTAQQKEMLSKEEQELLTTEPLTTEAIGTLINAAIELHGRAIAEATAAKWWVPLVAALPSFVGAIIGTLVGAIWGANK